MYSAENAGLIKFDFLGLKTLTVINNTSKMVIESDKDFDIKKINYNDQKVFELLSNGHTVGLFQLESSGMKRSFNTNEAKSFRRHYSVRLYIDRVQWQIFQLIMIVKHGKRNEIIYIHY